MTSVVEYVVFGVMMALNLGLGLYFSLQLKARSAHTPSEFFLGSRAMRVVPLAASVVASLMTSAGLIGFTGHLYAYGFHLMWHSIACIAMAPVVARIFLPVMYGLGVTSVFEGAGIATLVMLIVQMIIMWQIITTGAMPPHMPVTLDYCPQNKTYMGEAANRTDTSPKESGENTKPFFLISSFWSCLFSTCGTVVLGALISVATGEHHQQSATAKHTNSFFFGLWERVGVVKCEKTDEAKEEMQAEFRATKLVSTEDEDSL